MSGNNSQVITHHQVSFQRQDESLIVKLHLGDALRRVKWPKVFLRLRDGAVEIRREPLQDGVSTTKQQDDTPRETTKSVTHTQADSSSDSEIEILEVRPARKRKYHAPVSQTSASQWNQTESELSSLDEELNEALSTNASTEIAEVKELKARPEPRMMLNYPKLYVPPERSRSPPPPGYRNIPPNLMNAIHREMNLVFDGSADDEIEVVGKRNFSLKDPIARTKIKLPIKATTCRHFECFDFDNFCLFYKLPPGIRGGLKQSLVLQSREAREKEQLFIRQQQQIQKGSLLSKAPGLVYPTFSDHGQMFFTYLFNRTPPLYKCPLCDEKFGLKQLYISDIFNFFVKTTPLHTTKIALVENDRYKIVEEEKDEEEKEQFEVVDLSGDEEEENNVKVEKTEKNGDESETNSTKDHTSFTEGREADTSINGDDFNDGLDDFLSSITHGDGSWGNPMTLD